MPDRDHRQDSRPGELISYKSCPGARASAAQGILAGRRSISLACAIRAIDRGCAAARPPSLHGDTSDKRASRLSPDPLRPVATGAACACAAPLRPPTGRSTTALCDAIARAARGIPAAAPSGSICKSPCLRPSAGKGHRALALVLRHRARLPMAVRHHAAVHSPDDTHPRPRTCAADAAARDNASSARVCRECTGLNGSRVSAPGRLDRVPPPTPGAPRPSRLRHIRRQLASRIRWFREPDISYTAAFQDDDGLVYGERA